MVHSRAPSRAIRGSLRYLCLLVAIAGDAENPPIAVVTLRVLLPALEHCMEPLWMQTRGKHGSPTKRSDEGARKLHNSNAQLTHLQGGRQPSVLGDVLHALFQLLVFLLPTF